MSPKLVYNIRGAKVSIELQNTKKNFVIDQIRKRTGKTLSMYARHLKVSRKTIYESAGGSGSRRIRLEIARTLEITPSLLWPDLPKRQRIFDDVDYMEMSKWTI